MNPASGGREPRDAQLSPQIPCSPSATNRLTPAVHHNDVIGGSDLTRGDVPESDELLLEFAIVPQPALRLNKAAEKLPACVPVNSHRHDPAFCRSIFSTGLRILQLSAAGTDVLGRLRRWRSGSEGGLSLTLRL